MSQTNWQLPFSMAWLNLQVVRHYAFLIDFKQSSYINSSNNLIWYCCFSDKHNTSVFLLLLLQLIVQVSLFLLCLWHLVLPPVPFGRLQVHQKGTTTFRTGGESGGLPATSHCYIFLDVHGPTPCLCSFIVVQHILSSMWIHFLGRWDLLSMLLLKQRYFV